MSLNRIDILLILPLLIIARAFIPGVIAYGLYKLGLNMYIAGFIGFIGYIVCALITVSILKQRRERMVKDSK